MNKRRHRGVCPEGPENNNSQKNQLWKYICIWHELSLCEMNYPYEIEIQFYRNEEPRLHGVRSSF